MELRCQNVKNINKINKKKYQTQAITKQKNSNNTRNRFN